ncbi:MAG: hypothetical protein ACREV2_08510, partial [Burkholderiales bacterium]
HLSWAAKLHEIGISVSHSGYHKHSAYIIENADMPGFSRSDQETLALLVLGHRGSLKKLPDSLSDEPAQWKPLMALRIAALIYRSRRQIKPPPIGLTAKKQSVEMRVDESWLDTHPLTAAALADEMSEWKSRKLELRVTPSRHDLSRKTAAA